MSARVLILGGAGMLGHQMLAVLGREFDVCATFRDSASALRCRSFMPWLPQHAFVEGVEARNAADIANAVHTSSPDVVINCIGAIKQREESRQAIAAIELNALLPHRLAQLCDQQGARLIHFSTDCVFSGRRGAYTEDDEPDANDLYGRTKLLGEVSGANCLTLRTSIIGWELAGHRSLLGWFATQRGQRIRGYRRAIYSGLPTSMLARLVLWLIRDQAASRLSGLYQVASAPISKYDLLCALRDALRWQIDIEPDDDFACDRSLDASRFTRATGWTAPAWPHMINELAAQWPLYERGELS